MPASSTRISVPGVMAGWSWSNLASGVRGDTEFLTEHVGGGG